MGVYANNVETILSNFKGYENILHRYDNVAYHIEFFMVSQKRLYNYLKKKSELLSKFYNKAYTEKSAEDNQTENMTLIEPSNTPLEPPPETSDDVIMKLWEYQKELEEHKIIIAESGVTTTTSIESLSMTTNTRTDSPIEMLTTTEFELTLVETNSTSLVNRIAFGSLISGYDTYVQQPYFINIWFSGYEHETGKPIERIPLITLNNGFVADKMSYQVIIASDKSTTESSRTIHKMKLFISTGLLNTKESRIGDLGEIELHQVYNLNDSIKEVETKLNEKARERYTDSIINLIYGDKKPYSIYFVNIPSNTILVSRPDEFKMRAQQLRNLRERKNNINDEIKELEGESPSYSMSGGYEASDYVGIEPEDIEIEDLKYNLRITKEVETKKIKEWNNYVSSTIKIAIEDNETILSFIGKVLSRYFGLAEDGYLIIPKVTTVFMGTLDGKNYYRYVIALNIQYFPELKNDVDKNTPKKEYDKLANEEQMEYISYLDEEKMLLKKYSWYNSGKNTDVLNVKMEENLLWYLNSSMLDTKEIIENAPQSSFYSHRLFSGINPEEQQTPIDLVEILMSKNIDADDWLKADNEFMMQLEKEEKMENHNTDIFYLDDVFRQATDFYKSNISIKKWQSLAKSNKSLYADTLSGAYPDTDKKDNVTSDDEKDRIKYLTLQNRLKLGIENAFQTTGHKTKLEMDIIGDPYWVMGNLLYYDSNEIVSCYQPHLILMQPGQYIINNNDEYVEDKFNNFNTIYSIYHVVSIFENGKFIQRLTGYVPLSFLQPSRFEDDIVGTKKPNEENTNKAIDVQESKTGNVTDSELLMSYPSDKNTILENPEIMESLNQAINPLSQENINKYKNNETQWSVIPSK